LDDIQLTYHFKRWAQDKDPVLADLAARFLERRIFKATKIPVSSPAVGDQAPPYYAGERRMSENKPLREQIKEIENEARKIAKAAGLDPDYYIAIESTGFRPYDYYRPDADIPQTNIVVRTDGGEVRELSQLSLTVEALVKGNYASHWLIYPAELTDKIEQIQNFMPVG
jgi:hypothetical protein